jgi:hypothetical protein
MEVNIFDRFERYCMSNAVRSLTTQPYKDEKFYALLNVLFPVRILNIEGAEEKLSELGSSWEWLPDGSLKTITKALPAVRDDNGPGRTNTRNFFNSMVAAYTGYVLLV